MKELGRFRCYFYGNEHRNAPCGYKLVKIIKGRKYVYVVRDWSQHDCLNYKFKLSLTWWENKKHLFKEIA
jgi:hypothetical protein